MKGNKVLLLSLLAALVALMMVYAYIAKQEKGLLQSATAIEVVVALRDLPQDARLDETMVERRKVPKAFVQPGAISEVADVFDRVLNVPILAGTQILESMFKPLDIETVAKKIPSGLRAVSIAANEVSAVAGLIQPGNYVDLYLTVETGSLDSEGRVRQDETVTRLILQNVLVLANNQASSKTEFERRLFKDKQGAPGTVFSQANAEDPGQGKTIRTLTLALSPADVQKAVLAQEIGSVSVALRSSWAEDKDTQLPALPARQFLGIDKNVIRKSMPAWIEIRGAQTVNP